MATFNLTITYPDGQATRILDALKEHYRDADGNLPDNAGVATALEEEVARKIKNTVIRHEARIAEQTADSEVTVGS